MCVTFFKWQNYGARQGINGSQGIGMRVESKSVGENSVGKDSYQRGIKAWVSLWFWNCS